MSGKYIVVFKKNATDDQIKEYADEVNNNGGEVGRRYDSATVMRGFSAQIPDQFLQSLKGRDIIDYIEPDGEATTQ